MTPSTTVETMTTTPDAVDLALAAVDEDTFTRTADGTMIAQTSSREIIAAMIRELKVQPGDTVLEIGTGSGYSTALLAHLTGPTGSVVSLDVMPELTERAVKILHAAGYQHARAITGDGALGAPQDGPYDRIIAWTTPETVPAAWIAQAVDTARLVTPVNIAGLSKTYAVIAARINTARLISQPRVIRGAFVEMSAQIRTQWLLPPHGIDALHTDAEGKPWWLSSLWLRNGQSVERGAELAQRLAAESRLLESALRDDDDPVAFYAWLLATRPEGLTTACLGDPQWRIGHTAPGSAAFIPLADRAPLIAVGTLSSVHTLAAWVEQWRRDGSTGWEALRPHAAPAPQGDWTVRVSFGSDGD
jgi:protein-L-isoaspartate(D-aspartate) O-methyltransferase